MNREDIIARAMESGEAYAAGAQAERNKVAQWMIQGSYATGHGDTVEDLLKELEWQVEEACAKVCDDLAEKDKLSNYYKVAAVAIRARGQQ